VIRGSGAIEVRIVETVAAPAPPRTPRAAAELPRSRALRMLFAIGAVAGAGAVAAA